MKNMPPVKFSFAVSLVISFLFLLITFWIFYSYSWSAEAAKDALSTAGSYYGAAATLGAAVIAAYLYVDWRTQADYNFKLQYITSLVASVHNLTNEIVNIRSQKEVCDFAMESLLIIQNKGFSLEQRIEAVKLSQKSKKFASINKILELQSEINTSLNQLYFFDDHSNLSDVNDIFKSLNANINDFLQNYSSFTSIYDEKKDESYDLWVRNAFKCSNLFYQLREIIKLNIDNVDKIEDPISDLTLNLGNSIVELHKLKKEDNKNF